MITRACLFDHHTLCFDPMCGCPCGHKVPLRTKKVIG